MSRTVQHEFSLITEHDVYLFKQGRHYDLYDKLGSHLVEVEGVPGVFFAVWAPDAEQVFVMGDFNRWSRDNLPLHPRADGSGIWEGFVPALGSGTVYKYHIMSRYQGYRADKGDPFAFRWEAPPRTASMVWDLDFDWTDKGWHEQRAQVNAASAPWAVYEVHLGSWRRVPEEENRFLTYRELAGELVEYAREMGFTHVEFLPVMEHPFYGSWGYQVTGFFAPTSRYGSPQDFMYLVDRLHAAGVGVILDWVPSHFPNDLHGLAYFDGTYLFEHSDPKQGFHPHWNSYIFNYGRNEVRAFLASSARFWTRRYHADALRVDAVASMLYLDYGRNAGEWIPNRYGGNENLDAVTFLRDLNESLRAEEPHVRVIAEESTAWPQVSRPTHLGGLGFDMKWNMGWMHDTLDYMSHDPIHRKYHHNQVTFSIWYAFSENFVLPLSHDETVHGKGSLLAKMPGDEWQAAANLRLLYGYMYGHPGKKLLFMGSEFGQWREWNHDESLDWHLLQHDRHRGIHRWVQDLNALYRNEPALHDLDFDSSGFEWVEARDWEQSVLAFLRKGARSQDVFLVVCNFTPVPRTNYRIGVPSGGWWREVLNSDSSTYGGANFGNTGGLEASPVGAHGRYHSLVLTLPPLGVLFLKSSVPAH